MRSFEDVERAFDSGITRVVVSTMLVERPDHLSRTLEKYGSGKIVVGIDAHNGIVQIAGRHMNAGLTAVSAALNAKALGFKRIMYTDILRDGTMRGPNFASIKTLAEKTGMKVTAAGGVSGLEDLLKLQELEPFGVDSVVIGRALYENKFSCQGLWRMCEVGEFPYTGKV
jgi:phosphoribosylformimino-5-aminoimidazole carboxamide ribotide isomerase